MANVTTHIFSPEERARMAPRPTAAPVAPAPVSRPYASFASEADYYRFQEDAAVRARSTPKPTVQPQPRPTMTTPVPPLAASIPAIQSPRPVVTPSSEPAGVRFNTDTGVTEVTKGARTVSAQVGIRDDGQVVSTEAAKSQAVVTALQTQLSNTALQGRDRQTVQSQLERAQATAAFHAGQLNALDVQRAGDNVSVTEWEARRNEQRAAHDARYRESEILPM